MIELNKYVRPNIREMEAYSSARGEYVGDAKAWLDANENPNNTGLNRYPDPMQMALKRQLSEIKKLDPEQIFVGNGSDEAIDLLMRSFCEPGLDQVLTFRPSYGMYKVSASLNNLDLIELSLSPKFELPDTDSILSNISRGIIFICSPNNPTGNSFKLSDIEDIAKRFKGIVVVDEAYIDFSEKLSALTLIESCPNLVVLQTMSKAYGLAGARVGMAYATPFIIDVLNKVKPPYNVNTMSIEAAIKKLAEMENIKAQIQNINTQKEKLITALSELPLVIEIFPSDANFILVKIENAFKVFQYLIDEGIVVRNRTSQIDSCLRISIGTIQENQLLINTLNKFQ